MLIVISVTVALCVVMAQAAKTQRNVNERGGCPECGTPVPMFRNPTSLRQALWGGWTCLSCGCEMDRRGRELARQRSV